MKIKNLHLILILTNLLSFSFNIGHSQISRIRFEIMDFQTHAEIVNYSISVSDFLQNSIQDEINPNQGYLDIKPQSTLDVTFSAQDYLERVIRFDLRDVPEDNRGGFEMNVEIGLISNKIGFNEQILSVPSAIVYYNKENEALDLDSDYFLKQKLLIDKEIERTKSKGLQIENDNLRLNTGQNEYTWTAGVTSTYPWFTSEFRFYDHNNIEPSFQVLCPFINWEEQDGGSASLTSMPTTFQYLDNSIQEWCVITLPRKIYLLENGIFREDSLFHLLNECINSGMMTFTNEDFSYPDSPFIGFISSSARSKSFTWKDKQNHTVKKQVKCIGFSIDSSNDESYTYVDINGTFRDYTKNWYVSIGDTKKNFLESIECGDLTSEILNVKPVNRESELQSKLLGDESERKEYLKTEFVSELQYAFESQQDISPLINSINSATHVPSIVDSPEFITDFLLPNYFGCFVKEQVRKSCNKKKSPFNSRCDFEAYDYSFEGKIGRDVKSQKWAVRKKNSLVFEFNLFDNQVLQGPFKIYHANGNLSFQGEFQENELHSTLNEFYENGKLKATYNFTKGYLEGNQVEYFENGKIRTEYSMNGFQGELDGAFTDYYPDGSVKSKGNFSSNLKEGEWYYKIVPSRFWLRLIREIPKFEFETPTYPTTFGLLRTQDFVEVEAFHKIKMEDLPRSISIVETFNFINQRK